MPDDALTQKELRPFRRTPPASIGAFALRAASNELVGPSGLIRLRPRLMDVLLRLAVAPGEVVTRQELLDEVWPRRLVADEVLSRTIAELRIALGDDAREARYIETLPKVGYRLIAPVVAQVPDVPAEPPVSAQSAKASESDATSPSPIAPALTGWSQKSQRAGATYLTIAAALIGGLFAAWALWHVPAAGTPDAAAALERQLNSAEPFSSELDLELSPRFSPNGARVAFALGDLYRSRIVVQDVATRARSAFGDPTAMQISPVFFPDGQRLAFYREHGADCGIYERDLASGRERTLVPCSAHPFPRFDLAPDGRHLVFGSNEGGHSGLRLVDLASSSVTMLTSPSALEGDDAYPRFSPDGRRVAFMRSLQIYRELWTVPIDAPDQARAVGTPRGLAWGIAWLGAQGPLVVSADWSGFRALNVVDLGSGKATLIGARGAQFPDVSAHGDLVYEAAAYQANLLLLDTRDPKTAPVTLWPSTRYSNYPEISPDGQRVAFMSNRDNAASLFVGALGGEAHRIPLPSDFVFASAHWSHDGRALYAIRAHPDALDGPTDGVRIDPESGKVELLGALGSAVTDVRDNVDGTTLYFSVWEGPLMRLWRAELSELDRHERLSLPPVSDYTIAGHRLAYSEPGTNDLTVCELPAVRCAPVGLPPNAKRTSFALTQGGLWIGEPGDPGALYRLDLTRREVTLRLPYGPMAIGANLAIAPDERTAIIVREERPAIDLMLARHAH